MHYSVCLELCLPLEISGVMGTILIWKNNWTHFIYLLPLDMSLGVLRRLKNSKIVTIRVPFFRIFVNLSTSLVIYGFNIFETLSLRRNVIWDSWEYFVFRVFFPSSSYFVSQCNCFLMEPRRFVYFMNILFASDLNIFTSG